MLKKEIVHNDDMKFVGLPVRTSNEIEFEKKEGRIAKTLQRYFSEGIAHQIANRKNPGRMLCLYTDYETNEFGPYTYLVGEEVTAFTDQLPEGCVALTIPKTSFVKLTTEAGQMPQVVIAAWQEIWKMAENQLGGKRAYRTDFEVYDERAQNPEGIILDIFISLN